MKYLLIILFCFFGIAASSQIYTNPNPTMYGIQYLRIKPNLVLHIPAVADTSSIHTNDTTTQIVSFRGAIYVHFGTGYWKPIIGSSGGSDSAFTLYFDQTFTVGSYNPFTGDITQGVDTTNKVATKWDLTQITGTGYTDSTRFQYFVDTVARDTTGPYTKILFDSIVTGGGAGHAKQIGVKVGQYWKTGANYFNPNPHDKVVVTNPNPEYDVPTMFFAYEGGRWIKTNVPADIGGDAIGGNYDLGSTDNHITRIQANKKIGIIVRPNKKVALPGYNITDTARGYWGADLPNKNLVWKLFDPATIYVDSIASLSDSTGFYWFKNGVQNLVKYKTTSGGSGSVDYVKSGVGIKVDSTGRNYTVNNDTLFMSTRAWRQKGIDSVAALVNTKVSSVTASAPLASSGGTTPNISLTGVVPIANGGTNNGSLSAAAGTIYYGDGTKLVGLAAGTAGQHLTGGTIPSWKDTAVASGGGSGIDSLYRQAKTDSLKQRKSGVYSLVTRDTTLGVQLIPSGMIVPDSSNTIGNIYDSSSWNTGGFFNVGGTVNVTNNKFVFPGGTSVLEFKWGTMLNQESVQVDYKYKTALNANDSGLVIAWNSIYINTLQNQSVVAYLNTKSGADFGKATVVHYLNGVVDNIYRASHAIASISTNDSITVICTHSSSGNEMIYAKNNTTGDTSSLTIPVNFTFGAVTGWFHNTAKLSIATGAQSANYLTGSTSVEIDRIKWSSTQLKNPAAILRGNSIVFGNYVSSFKDKMSSQLLMVPEAGGGDITAGYVSTIYEMLYIIGGRNIFMEFTGNDAGFGVASATTRANLLQVRDSAIANNRGVVMLFPFPRSINFSSDTTWIKSNFTKYIDTYNPLLGTGTALNPKYGVNDGGIHLNSLGNTVAANTIKESQWYKAIGNGYLLDYYGGVPRLANPSVTSSEIMPAGFTIDQIRTNTLFGTSAGRIFFTNGSTSGNTGATTTANFNYDSLSGRLNVNSVDTNYAVNLVPKFGGVASITSGTATVNGTTTLAAGRPKFTKDFFPNQGLVIGATNFVVSSITNDSVLVVTTNAGATLTNQAYYNSSTYLGLLNIRGNGEIHLNNARIFHYLSGSMSFGANTPSVYNLGNLFSTFIGNNAGTGATSAGSNNTIIGSSAFPGVNGGGNNLAIGARVMASGTGGSNNIAIGPLAMFVGGGTSYNGAIGDNVLSSLTGGNFNYGFGSGALAAAVSGSHNIAFGGFALAAINSSSSSNIGIGTAAGRYLANGSTQLTSCTGCIFMGESTKLGGTTQGLSNVIVIGHQATSLAASNTTLIGNTSVTDTRINGKINVAGSADQTAQTASGNVTTYTTGAADSTFNIAGRLTVTSVTGGTVTLQVTYTDETNTSRTISFFNMGATTAALSTTGVSSFPMLAEVRVKASTTITVATVVTGTITFNAGATITKIR